MTTIRESLAGRFYRSWQILERADDGLLVVDREYHERTADSDLPRSAPRRFNPNCEAWLPILHTERGDRCRAA